MNIRLYQWNGSDAKRELTQTVIRLNEAANSQHRSMIRLTWAIAIATLAMLIAVGIQIWIAWPI
jgi:hypothetical protein